MLASKKDEVICSENELLRKLVHVYVMFFVENKNKNKTEKKQKEKNLIILTIIC